MSRLQRFLDQLDSTSLLARGTSKASKFDGLMFGTVAAVTVLLAGVFVVRSTPRSEFELRLADGSAWLPSLAIGGVSLLDGSSGSIATSLGVAEGGDRFEVVQWGSDAILVNESAGTVSRLDGANWTIATGRVQFGEPGAALDVVAGQHSGWLIQPGSVAPLDLETLEQRSASPVSGRLAEGLVAEDGSLLYASLEKDLPLRRFSAESGSTVTISDMTGPIALRDLGSSQVGVDLDDQRVWLEGSGVVCSRLEFPEDASLSVGGGDDQLLIVSDLGGLMMWAPADTGCPESSDFVAIEPGIYGEPVVTDGWGVVPDFGRGEVIVVDLDGRSIVARQSVPGVATGSSFELLAETGSIWFNDPNSTVAGLIRRNGEIVPIAKYDQGSESGFVAAPVDDPAIEGQSVALSGSGFSSDSAAPDLANQQAPSETNDGQSPQSDELTPVTQPSVDPLGPTLEGPTTTAVAPETGQPGTSRPSEPQTTSPTTTKPTSTVPPIIDIQLASTASQIKSGETITFQAVTVTGNPRFFDLQVSPDTGSLGNLVSFGRFDYTFSNPGNYRVTLQACDPDNFCDSETVAVSVIAPEGQIELVAAILAQGEVTVGKPASFFDASQGEPTEWSWAFQDGTPSSATGQNPTATFATTGTKTIGLSVKSADGRSASTSITINVVAKAPPYLLTIVGDSSVTVGETVGYSVSTTNPNGAPDPHWNVQGADMVTPNGGSLQARWSTPGTYEITVDTTSDGGDGAGSLMVTVTEPEPVIEAPLVSIEGPSSLETGQTGNWSVSNSGGSIASYDWQVTPGAASTAATRSESFATAGTYTVMVTATGPGGSDSASRTVTVSDPTPEASPFSLACDVTTLQPSNWSKCKLVGDPADFASFDWSVSWPDPAQANSWGASAYEFHIGYLDVGQVTVTLAAQDLATGLTVSKSVVLSYVAPSEPAPVVALSGPASRETSQGGTYTFANTGGSIDSISWSSSGLASGSAADYDASWAAAGTYTVTVTVNGPGGSDTASITVTVAEPAPVPASMGLACPTPVAVGDISYCQLVGDPANFTGYSWSIAWPNPALANSWLGELWTMNVGYGEAASFTVTVSATDVATGLPVSASATVTFQ